MKKLKTEEYKELKKKEMQWAEDFISRINASEDINIRYKVSHPITDLKDMFRQSVERYGRDHVQFKQRFVKGHPFREITLGEAWDDVNGLGTAMMNHGLDGKRIAVIGDNCYQWASTYLAVTGGVGIIVPLDKELGAQELTQLVRESEVSAVCFTKKHQKTFLEMREILRKEKESSGEERDTLDILINLNLEENDEELNVLSWSAMIEEGKKLMEDGDNSYQESQIINDEMGVLLFTSGTTGIAKGVMLSQRNICADLMSAPTLLDTNERDTFFSILPLHHTYECTCGFLMPVYKGSCIAYCEGLKYMQKNLQELKPTFFLAVPLIFESIYKKIWKNIRAQGKEKTVKRVMKLNRLTSKMGINLNERFLKDITGVFGGNMDMLISGGAAIDAEVLNFFNELGLVAVQGYGLTECAPMAALNPDIHGYLKSDSVGHVLPGVEAKIVDQDESGIGEICLKGPNVMMGYYNMPEETEKVLRDGWFHTGDLGYVDKQNFIYLTGRKKNVIITRNGKNVFPEELEFYLGKIPYVSECMVWAEADESGQDDVIIATIQPDLDEVGAVLGKANVNDAEAVRELLWKEVDKINENLPLFKQIRKIGVRYEDFEKTTGHKIKRFVESNKNS